jgi:transposase-like protein
MINGVSFSGGSPRVCVVPHIEEHWLVQHDMSSICLEPIIHAECESTGQGTHQKASRTRPTVGVFDVGQAMGFTDEFKVEAVQLVMIEGHSASQSEDLGIRDSLLRCWHRKLHECTMNAESEQANGDDSGASAISVFEQDVIRPIKLENGRLLIERDILKNRSAYSQSSEIQLRFIREQYMNFSVRLMCPVLGVTPSGFLNWLERRESKRIELASQGQAQFPRHYRQPLRPPERSQSVRLSVCGDDDGSDVVAGYQLYRDLNRVQFEIHRFRVRSSPSGRLWKAGTYGFRTERGLGGLAVFGRRAGLFLRQVVNLVMGRQMPQELNARCFRYNAQTTAIVARLDAQRSDAGSQYAANLYQTRFIELGLVCSMSRKVSCWGN